MDNVNMKMIASAMAVGWAACALAVGGTGALADERDLRPLEMWGGRKAHPAVVHSVTAVSGDPWTLSLRGEWEVVQNRPRCHVRYAGGGGSAERCDRRTVTRRK